jgi:hypothetical protein
MEKVKYNRKEYREEYLKSDEWKKLRNLIMSTSPDCQCCGGASSDVHHMVYRNIADITINDLIPVCRSCHEYIHQAIDDNYISQEPRDFKIIKEKTFNILNDNTYKEFRKWLGDKHSLSVEEISDVKRLQAFVIKKISALVKKNIWHDDLPDRKFTGRQILKIRKIIEVAKYRRGNRLDWNKSLKKTKYLDSYPNKDKLDNYSKFDYIPKLKDMKGFKSRKSIIDIN